MTPRRLPLCLSLLTLLATGRGHVLGQADATVPDPDPEKERRALQVADGFEVSLFAADPLLAKPIQMNFDPAGRLWVACSQTYPQIKPGQKADDKILVLEDSDGDGKADKVTVFADGLLIPTGLEPGDGGVYVGASTELLHFSRPDGDKGPLRRRVVLSGFGTEDTHHMVHTLRWGHDGMLYFNQSIYIHSHIETPYGVRRLGGGGIWQFRPQTGQLEVFARGWWNTWGHHFDRWGQSFITDGAGGEGVNYGVPGASYTATPGAPRVLTGLNPGHPKYCGCEIVSGRHLPESWQGSLVTNDFRGHRVCRFTLQPEGSGYSARQEADVIKSSHPAFRPIDVKMGPDGAIYIADWYNPIIQHGEVDFRDPRRDVTHGRIWRITAKGRPLVPRPKLVDAKTSELLKSLDAPEGWTRHMARRVLQERGAETVLPELKEWTASLLAGPKSAEPLLMETLWTWQALDRVEPKLLGALLDAKDHRVRAAAVRVAGAWHDRLSDALALLSPRAVDPHPQVRLEAVRALSLLDSAQAADAALAVLDHPMDRYLDYALWHTVRELEPRWAPALESSRFPTGGSPQRLLFAVQAVDSTGGVAKLVRFVRSGKLAADAQLPALMLLAQRGGPRELALVLEQATAEAANVHVRASLLAALDQAAHGRGVRPEGDLSRLEALLKSPDDSVRTAAARLAGAWKLESTRQQLTQIVRATTEAESVRLAALDGLEALGGPASAVALARLAADEKASAIRRRALLALLSVAPDVASKHAAAVLAACRQDDEAAEIFGTFLERKDGAGLLTDALRDKKLPTDVAKVGARTVRLTGRPAKALLDELARAGNLTAVNHILTPEQLRTMVTDVARKGDPARGELVFRRRDLQCLNCHAISGAGGQVGPDLASVGASAQADYLIESLLLPAKAIKENYHAMLVSTTTGKQYTGIKVRQTKDTLVLRTAEDKEVAIAIKDIDEQGTGGSLMPEGLTDGLTRQEMLDLVRFLSELGKVGAYAPSKARLVRRFEALDVVPANKAILGDAGLGPAVADAPGLVWGPVYGTVAGLLPCSDLPRHPARDRAQVAVVRFRLDVTTGGPVRFVFNDTEGLFAWLDGKPTPVPADLVWDVKPGAHVVTLTVRPERRAPLRVELEDVTGSTARATLVGGK